MAQQLMRQTTGSAPAAPATDTGALFAPGEVQDYTGYALRAVRRRFVSAAVTALFFLGAVGFALRALPPRYHVVSRIYALPAEGAPGAVRGASDEPGSLAQGAVDVVVAQRTLRELVQKYDLVNDWNAFRSPLSRLLERVRALGEPATPAAPHSAENAMAGYLQQQLKVQVKGPEVFIDFDWPDARVAYEVVRDSEQALLQSRRDAELAPLERRAAALEQDVATAQRRIDAAISGIETATRARRRGARSSSVRGMQAEGRFGALPDARLAKERLEIIAQRKAIAELEDVRRKHLSDLNATYAEQKATLGPGNPALLDTQEKLKALDRQGAQIDAMKAREQQLLAAFVQGGGKEAELTTDASPVWPTEIKEDDETVSYGKARIGMELSELQHLLGELSAAQVAVAAARAAFDDRYVVLQPAEIPEKPASTRMLWIAGALGAVLLGLFAALARDLRGGIIRERWQADRLLGLPVLAEVSGP